MSDSGQGTVYDSLQLTFDSKNDNWFVSYIAYGIPNLLLLAVVFGLLWLQGAKQRSVWDVPGWFLEKSKNVMAWFYLSLAYYLAWVFTAALLVARGIVLMIETRPPLIGLFVITVGPAVLLALYWLPRWAASGWRLHGVRDAPDSVPSAGCCRLRAGLPAGTSRVVVAAGIIYGLFAIFELSFIFTGNVVVSTEAPDGSGFEESLGYKYSFLATSWIMLALNATLMVAAVFIFSSAPPQYRLSIMLARFMRLHAGAPPYAADGTDSSATHELSERFNATYDRSVGFSRGAPGDDAAAADDEEAAEEADASAASVRTAVCLYSASLVVIIAYSLLNFFLSDNRSDAGKALGFVVASALIILDSAVALMYVGGLVRSPGRVASVVALSRGAVLIFGARFWLIGLSLVYVLMGLFLANAVVDQHYARLREVQVVKALGGIDSLLSGSDAGGEEDEDAASRKASLAKAESVAAAAVRSGAATPRRGSADSEGAGSGEDQPVEVAADHGRGKRQDGPGKVLVQVVKSVLHVQLVGDQQGVVPWDGASGSTTEATTSDVEAGADRPTSAAEAATSALQAEHKQTAMERLAAPEVILCYLTLTFGGLIALLAAVMTGSALLPSDRVPVLTGTQPQWVFGIVAVFFVLAYLFALFSYRFYVHDNWAFKGMGLSVALGTVVASTVGGVLMYAATTSAFILCGTVFFPPVVMLMAAMVGQWARDDFDVLVPGGLGWCVPFTRKEHRMLEEKSGVPCPFVWLQLTRPCRTSSRMSVTPSAPTTDDTVAASAGDSPTASASASVASSDAPSTSQSATELDEAAEYDALNVHHPCPAVCKPRGACTPYWTAGMWRNNAMLLGVVLLVACLMGMGGTAGIGFPRSGGAAGWIIPGAVLLVILTGLPLYHYFSTLEAFHPFQIVTCVLALLVHLGIHIPLLATYANASSDDTRAVALVTATALSLAAYPSLVVAGAALYKWADDGLAGWPSVGVIACLAGANVVILGVIIASFIVYTNLRVSAVVLIAYVALALAVTYFVVYKRNGNYLPKGWVYGLVACLAVLVLGGIAMTIVEFFVNSNIVAAVGWFSAAYLTVCGLILVWGLFRLVQAGVYASSIGDMVGSGGSGGSAYGSAGRSLYFSTSFLPAFEMSSSGGPAREHLRYPSLVLGGLGGLVLWGIIMLSFLSPAYIGLVVLEAAKVAGLIFVLDAAARGRSRVAEACEALSLVRVRALANAHDSDGPGAASQAEDTQVTLGVYGALRMAVGKAASELALRDAGPSDVSKGAVPGVVPLAPSGGTSATHSTAASVSEVGMEDTAVVVHDMGLRDALKLLLARYSGIKAAESSDAQLQAELCNYMNVLPWCHVLTGEACGDATANRCPALCQSQEEYLKSETCRGLQQRIQPPADGSSATAPSITASASATAAGDAAGDAPSTNAVEVARDQLSLLYTARFAAEQQASDWNKSWLQVLAHLQHFVVVAGATAAEEEAASWLAFLEWVDGLPVPILAQMVPHGAIVRVLKELFPVASGQRRDAGMIPGIGDGVSGPPKPSQAIAELLRNLAALGPKAAPHFSAAYVVSGISLSKSDVTSPAAVSALVARKLGAADGRHMRSALDALRRVHAEYKIAQREAEEQKKREDEEADRKRREAEEARRRAVADAERAAQLAAEAEARRLREEQERREREAAAAAERAAREAAEREAAEAERQRKAAEEAERQRAEQEAAAAAAAAAAQRRAEEEEKRRAAAAAEIARLADEEARRQAEEEEAARQREAAEAQARHQREVEAARKAAEEAAAAAAAAAAAESRRRAEAEAEARRAAEEAAAKAAAKAAAAAEAAAAAQRRAEEEARKAEEEAKRRAASGGGAAAGARDGGDADGITSVQELLAASGGAPRGGIITGPGPDGISLEEAREQLQAFKEAVKASGQAFFSDPSFVGESAVGSDVRTELEDAWARPAEFAVAPKMLDDGPCSGDVQQGSLGDCWLLSAFAVLAEHKDLMQQVLVSDEVGDDAVVGVRLFKNGKWRLVITDDSFPIKKEVFSYAEAPSRLFRGNYKQRDMRGMQRLAAPAFCSSATRDELWPMALEKAYARYFGSYSSIVGGLVHTALVDLTGGSGLCIDLKSDESKADIRSGALWKKILQFHESGYLMGCGSNSGSDSDVSAQGVVQGHAYSILNVVEAADQYGTHQLIRARNPWGSTEFKGKYSDFDTRSWTKRLRTKVGYDPDNADDDDGAFFIGFRDFVTQFRNLYVLRRFVDVSVDPSKGWHRYSNRGAWVAGSTSGGRTSCEGTWKNPHFFLKVSRPSTVFISLVQHEKEGSGSRDYIAAGFAVVDNGAKRVARVYAGELPFGWGPMTNSREGSQEITIEDPEKTYMIWVATWDPDTEAEFTLTVHSQHPLQDALEGALKPVPEDWPHN